MPYGELRGPFSAQETNSATQGTNSATEGSVASSVVSFVASSVVSLSEVIGVENGVANGTRGDSVPSAGVYSLQGAAAECGRIGRLGLGLGVRVSVRIRVRAQLQSAVPQDRQYL